MSEKCPIHGFAHMQHSSTVEPYCEACKPYGERLTAAQLMPLMIVIWLVGIAVIVACRVLIFPVLGLFMPDSVTDALALVLIASFGVGALVIIFR